jgi:signal transduction histidine kinase
VTVIDGYVKLMIQRAAQYPPNARIWVEHIRTSISHLNRMIADLLDVSRIEARHLTLNCEPVDLPALVRGAVERMAETTAGHQVQVDVNGEIPRLEIDPVRVEQILANLLSNAANYSVPNTETLVKIARADGDVVVSVTNQGPGISPKEMPQLFNRFYRTDEARGTRVGGIGLGLYISKGLVEAHGGQIWAESIPGQTTTFSFTLPIPT